MTELKMATAKQIDFVYQMLLRDLGVDYAGLCKQIGCANKRVKDMTAEEVGTMIGKIQSRITPTYQEKVTRVSKAFAAYANKNLGFDFSGEDFISEAEACLDEALKL